MFTHKLDPKTGKYARLQTMQLKRLNGIFSLDVSDANKLAEAKNAKIKSADLYKNSPMLFPSYVDAYCTCTKIIIEMIKVQSLHKVTAVWPMLLSLGTSDGWTFQDLVKTRRDYHEALRLLMSYVVVVENSHLDELTKSIGVSVHAPAVTHLEDALRAELILPDYKYKTNFLCALKTLNQAKRGPDTCHS